MLPVPRPQDRLARIEVRRAIPSDIPALAALESARFASDRLSPRSLAAFVRGASAIFLVAAARGDVPLGYAVALTRRGARSVRLYSIAVSEDAAGGGIGALLLGAIEDEAARHGADSVRLEVRADNPVAIGFYERRGYRFEGTRPGYYADGMEARRYRRRLPPAERRAA